MLYLDFEAFNGEKDISVGTYEYARTAEILLAAYAIDDGPTALWDLTATPEAPALLVDALRDPDQPITAHNANFDRTVLRAQLAPRLGLPAHVGEPERWRCTMVKAMTLGFPGALDACGRILGLPQDAQKRTDGKRLIHRFCKPAPRNHKADRYDRQSHPEEWDQFCAYAIRDIDAMREIDRRLPDWNYRGQELAIYHLDQRINDRGASIDKALVAAGARAAATEKDRIAERCAQLTKGLVPRPTMREALRQYLNEVFGLKLSNTQAATLRGVLAERRDALPDDARELIRAALAANKTSTAKYKALAPAVSPDGRFRGSLQFAGAARTRRWCLAGDHEVLTPSGWERLDRWRGGQIAQWRDGIVTFAEAKRVAFDYSGPLLVVERKNKISAAMTPEHTLCLANEVGARTAGAAFGLNVNGIPRGGVLNRQPCSTIRTRVLVMLQHDGSVARNTVVWQFAKKRKSTRCQKLLAAAGVAFTASVNSRGIYRVYVPTATKPEWLIKRNFGPWLLEERHCPRAFIDEAQHWDGGNRREGQVEVCSKLRVNAEWTATMAHLAGYACTLSKRANGYWFANISMTGNNVSIKASDWSVRDHTGKVYCAATRTGYFLVRRNDIVHVTGNSGRVFQPQNLSSRGLPPQDDIDLYIDALKNDVHDILFEDQMLFASAALRGVIVAPSSRKLVVADLSNIEGRANAWLAGETWKLKAFEAFDRGKGPDLYNITAGMILGKNPSDITKSERNAFGKVPELACGYASGVNGIQTFARAYGITMVDHWPTIKHTMGAYADAAADNYAVWGRERAPEMAELEWIASETIKLAWRDRHPAITRLWKACETAARRALAEPGRTFIAGPMLRFKLVRFAGHRYLAVRLPSGQFLTYFAPRVEPDETLTYMGLNSFTRQWERIATYGGKFCENFCQSVSRDAMAASMPAIEADGFEILFTVHDEIVTEVPDDPAFSAERLAALMATPPAWAAGFPLAAAGFEATRYRKD